MADDTIADKQDEIYLKLRKQGIDKQTAAKLANPPTTTEKRANS